MIQLYNQPRMKTFILTGKASVITKKKDFSSTNLNGFRQAHYALHNMLSVQKRISQMGLKLAFSEEVMMDGRIKQMKIQKNHAES